MPSYRLRAGMVAISVLVAGIASAQTAPSRGFVGGGIDLLTDSSLSANRSTDTSPLPLAWFVEGAVFTGGPIAIGAELLRAPVVTTSYSSSAGALTEDYQDTSLLGVIRARAGRSGNVAFDLLGGAGIIFQRRSDSSIPRSTPTPSPVQTDVRGESPVFMFGADLPVALAAHFALAPTVRVYLFRRGSVGNGLIAIEPSTGIAVGVSGRVVW